MSRMSGWVSVFTSLCLIAAFFGEPSVYLFGMTRSYLSFLADFGLGMTTALSFALVGDVLVAFLIKKGQ